MAKKSKIIKICERCGKDYHPRNDRVKTSRYCCFDCTRKPKIPKICIVCGKKYECLPFKEKQTRFCSRKCQHSLKGPDHFLYGAKDKPWSYQLIGNRNIPDKCFICSISKSSKKRMEIHHIDTNKKNFKIENLCKLCPSCHRKVHYLIKKGIDHFNALFNFSNLYFKPERICKRHK